MFDTKKNANPHALILKPYQPGKPIETLAAEYNLPLDAIAKLASNETPFGPSPRAIRAMRTAIKEQHLYPDGASIQLRDALSKFYRLSPDKFMIGQGSNEILELIAHAFLSPEKGAITPAYSFAVYRLVAKLFNAPIVEVPTDSKFNVLPKSIVSTIEANPNTRVLFLCNPNNPTGTFFKKTEVEYILNHISSDILVVLDEAYAEIALSGNFPNSIPWLEKYKNVLILRTFSKAYGLAGLRVGYAMGDPSIIDVLNRVRQPFNTTRLSQAAATAAIKDRAFVRKSKEHFKNSAELFYNFFEEKGLEYIPTCANFILVHTGEGDKVCKKLEEQGLIVRPMSPYGLGEWIRISFGTEKENQRLIQAMREMTFRVK